MISVSIVEDDLDIRKGLELIITGTTGFSCLNVYEDAESALSLIPFDPPNVVLMDIRLPGMSGIECVRRIKGELPDLDIIMLTAHEDDEYVFESLCAGASGYILKDTPPTKLLDAIRETHEGGAALSNKIARMLVGSFRNSPVEALTGREKKVLQLLCAGKSYKMIAETIFVSPDTVRFHIKNIYRKLQVHSKSEAVAKALREKLVL